MIREGEGRVLKGVRGGGGGGVMRSRERILREEGGC